MKYRILAAAAALAMLATVVVAPTTVGAGEPGSPTKLNTALQGGQPDRDPAITPDGSTVVYLAPQDTIGTLELYAVPIEGGAPVKLNHVIPAGDRVENFKLTPDGSRVLYTARNTTSDPVRLWSVPVGGGTPQNLSGSVSGDVGEYQITPDSARVVFLAEGNTADITELYSRAIDGSGSRVRLNGPLSAAGDLVLDRLIIAPDSSRVVYRIYDDSAELFQLYSADTDAAGTQTLVNGALVGGGNVDGDDYVVTPDSQHVVYLADQDTDDVYELYRAPITGGGSTIKLSGTVTAAPGVIEGSTYVSPDGQYVVFRLSTSSILQLYSARVDGTGSRVRLNPALMPGAQVDGSIFIAPNSQRVVYLADQDTDDLFELYSVPIGGGTSVKISGPTPTEVADDDQVPGVRILITPDSSRVVFKAVRDGEPGLFSGSLTGGNAPRLSGTLDAGGVFDDFKVTPDSAQAIYIAAQRPGVDGSCRGIPQGQPCDLLFEVWRVPVTGGTPERINGELAGGAGDVQEFTVSPTSGHVVYVADETTDDLNEVYQVALGVTCGGRLATIIIETSGVTTNGTAGPDVIIGTNGVDTINGLGGGDTICGNGGADIINGGGGADSIFGGGGADTINGGGGPDTIRGGGGPDTIRGGNKADTIFGNGGRDQISGGKGPDTISGGNKADTLDGNNGRDTIRGNNGRDTIDGGNGIDTCVGGAGIDTLTRCP